MGVCLPSPGRADAQKLKKRRRSIPARSTRRNGETRGQRLRVGEGRAQPEQARQVVLDRRLVVRLLAELPAEPCDQARARSPRRWSPSDRRRTRPARSRRCRGRSRFSIAERIGAARNPAARVPARTTSSCCCAADSWLVDVLNTISDRMSDWSSGGVLASRSSGSCSGPKMLTRVSTPEITRVHRDVDLGVQIAAEVDRARLDRRRSGVPETRRCR